MSFWRVTAICLAFSVTTVFAKAFNFSQVCPKFKFDKWTTIIKGATRVGDPIEGNGSGVVNSDGQRKIYQKLIKDCDGMPGITLRFSEDIIPRDGKPSVAAYEVFVKDNYTNEITGFGLNSEGEYIDTVPNFVATDKDGNKDVEVAVKDDPTIRSRQGCMACHDYVSFQYEIPGAEAFWKHAKIVKELRREDLLVWKREVVDKKLKEERLYTKLATQRAENQKRLNAAEQIQRQKAGSLENSLRDLKKRKRESRRR